jgi:hypothetical protein
VSNFNEALDRCAEVNTLVFETRARLFRRGILATEAQLIDALGIVLAVDAAKKEGPQ